LIQGFERGFRDALMKMTVLLKKAMGLSYDEAAKNSHNFAYTSCAVF
jgi:hypothetical protein